MTHHVQYVRHKVKVSKETLAKLNTYSMNVIGSSDASIKLISFIQVFLSHSDLILIVFYVLIIFSTMEKLFLLPCCS